MKRLKHMATTAGITVLVIVTAVAAVYIATHVHIPR